MGIVFTFIKKYYSLIFFGIILILSVFLFQTCNTLKNERAQKELQDKLYTQNMNALKDSIKVEFNKKLQALEFSKQSFVVEKFKDLEQYDKQLYDQLNKVKGDIMDVIDAKLKVDAGKVSLGNKLEIINKDNGYYGLRFSRNYADSGFSQKIGGSSRFYANYDEKIKTWNIKPDTTLLDTNQMSLKIIYGTRQKDKGYEVFAISRSPLVSFKELTGSYFIENQVRPTKKVKKWAIGPYLGAGIVTDINGSNPRLGWSAGISIHYDIWQLW